MCVAGVGCKKAIVENRALLGAVVVKADTGHACEKTYSTDSGASISVVSVACPVSAFIMPFITILVQPLFLKGSIPWTSIATITIGLIFGLATLLGCL